MAISRRSFLRISSASALGVLLTGKVAYAEDIVLTNISGNTFIYEKSGGTILIHTSADGLVIVDTQFPQSIEGFPAHFKLSDSKKIDFLINTHHHGDHTGGNQLLGKFADKMVAHKRVPELLTELAKAKGEEPGLIPTTTFTDTWKAELGKETIKAFHFGPAHTSGDSVIYFEKDNVAHVGDLCFNKLHPVIDRSAGASIQNWTIVLEKIMNTLPKDCRLVFGHSGEGYPVTGNADNLMFFKSYLTALLEAANNAVKTGKTKEELQKLPVLKGFEDVKSRGNRLSLPFVLGLAYDEVTGA
ncbi:MBL fold metallo-hydrolase [bacterium]|nr:MAG: MBL fold metallo-hydrolase [bacterium]